MRTNKAFSLLLVALLSVMGAKGQNVAMKTNIIPDATLSPNVGVELKLASHWSAELTGQMNLWPINDHKWKHWLVQPEVRYWFCEPFVKGFMGLHLIGGEYNVGNINNNIKLFGNDFSKLKDYRYEGWAVGAGIAYGYAFPLTKHWNFEAEIGVGYVYTEYDKFKCKECGRKMWRHHINYYGPTKAALNLVYVF
ncbi:MAG: DUF3575 domain-containing protein [Prevotellaceae bacterium]|nr:DUF3575 domain-containing protein [Prevotellaceae bacterium]